MDNVANVLVLKAGKRYGGEIPVQMLADCVMGHESTLAVDQELAGVIRSSIMGYRDGSTGGVNSGPKLVHVNEMEWHKGEGRNNASPDILLCLVFHICGW